MKKIISVIVLSTLLFTLFSCGNGENRSYDKDEVVTAAKDLIERSREFNEIFWGSGIPYIEEDSLKNGEYYPADPVYLQKLGVKNVSDIISEAGKIFSSAYIQSIYKSTFSSSVGEFGMTGYTRYYQGTETVMIYSKYKPLLTDSVEYDLQTVSALRAKGEKVIVSVSVNVTRGDTSQKKTIEIALIEEDDGWRIDSPTYAVYYAE